MRIIGLQPTAAGAIEPPRLKPHVSGTVQNSDDERSRKPWITKLNEILEQVRALVARGEVRVSLHGYEELAADNVPVRDIIDGLTGAEAVEEYPNYPKGPCVLVLERDKSNQPIHVVCGIPAGQSSPAVVITAYRPDPMKWDETWRRRRK